MTFFSKTDTLCCADPDRQPKYWFLEMCTKGTIWVSQETELCCPAQKSKIHKDRGEYWENSGEMWMNLCCITHSKELWKYDSKTYRKDKYSHLEGGQTKLFILGWNSENWKCVYAFHRHASSICFPFLLFFFCLCTVFSSPYWSSQSPYACRGNFKNSMWLSAFCKFKTSLTISGKCSSPSQQMIAVLGRSYPLADLCLLVLQ